MYKKLLFLLSISLISTVFGSSVSEKNKFYRLNVINELKRDPARNSHCKFKRVLLGLSCPDVDHIPKVPNAGKIISKDGKQFQIMHNGLLIHKGSYYEHQEGFQWATDLIYGLQGHHEPQEEKAFHEVLKYIPRGGNILELGGYWSFYSMWFKKTIPNSKAYIIEGSKSHLEMGKRNFKANNLKGDFTHAFVGRKSDPDIDSGAPFISLEDYFNKKNITHLNILHMDIQGAEYKLLEQSDNILRNEMIDYLFISTHQGLYDKLKELLSNYNYEILCSHSRPESYTVDGLIVAKLIGVSGPKKIPISKR